jgi:hypothetical protein
VGDILVIAQLSMGYQRLRLYFTDRRIIASHLTKVGAGSVAPTFMFGSIGNALGGLLGRKKGGARSTSQYPGPDSILAGHRSNFSIALDEIVSVNLARGAYKNSITLLSKDDKYEFTSPARFDKIRLLFENALPDRVQVQTQ